MRGMARADNGVIAIVLGLLAAVVLFVPFVAVSYRRRGGLTPGRSATWLAALIYAFAIVAYTLLPVPDGPYRCVGYWLDPLDGFREISDPQYRGFSTFANPAVQQLALNVLLFVPFGVLLRALTGRGVPSALLFGFFASLTIETTQRTGVWGLFPCAYRLFDTGDLLTNTTGAVLGSALSWVLFRHRRPDGHRLPAAAHVSLSRRLLGITCDLLLAIGIASVAAGVLNAYRLLVLDQTRAEVVGLAGRTGDLALLLAIAITGAATVLGGATLGERAVLLTTDARWRPAMLWRAVRYGLGLGGVLAILVVDAVPDWTLGVVVAVTGFGILVTREHRGFALLLSGLSLRPRGAG